MTVLRSYVSGTWTAPADDGRPVLRVECRLCGYGAAWDGDEDGTGGDW